MALRPVAFMGASASGGNGDVDAYTVVLQAGLSYEFETRYPDDNVDAGTYVDPALRLFDPNGSQVATADFGGDERNAKISDFTPPVGGIHLVEVFSANPARPTGSYDLRVQPAADPKPPLVFSLRRTTSGSDLPASQQSLSVTGSKFQGATDVTIDPPTEPLGWADNGPVIAEFSIGGGGVGSLILLDTIILDGRSSFELDINLLPTGVDLYLQAAILDGTSPAFPLTPTNWAEARKAKGVAVAARQTA